MTPPKQPWDLVIKRIDDLEANIKEDLDHLTAIVEEQDKVLRGGNGERLGLCATVADIKRTVEEDHMLLCGKDDEPGLKGQVSKLNNGMDIVTKLIWIIATGVIGYTIVAVIELIIKRG